MHSRIRSKRRELRYCIVYLRNSPIIDEARHRISVSICVLKTLREQEPTKMCPFGGALSVSLAQVGTNLWRGTPEKGEFGGIYNTIL